jgi:hypothetical protein
VRSDSIRQVVNVPLVYDNPRLTAKYYKLHPHQVIPAQYTHSLFCDSRIIPTPRLLAELNRYRSMTGVFVVFKHRERCCIYKEGVCVTNNCLDWNARVGCQLDRYKRMKFPSDQGLIDSCCLFMSHKSPDVIRLNTYWFQEIMSGSTLVQLRIMVFEVDGV